MNDTGDADLLKAVYDAKGWVADGQLGPTLVQSINDMEKDQPLKEVLLNKVKDSLGSFIMEQDREQLIYRQAQINIVLLSDSK